jgi:hypothetical protein
MSSGLSGDVRWERRDALLRLIAFLSVALPLSVMLAISFMVTPGDIESGRVVLSGPCTFHQLFGLDCPMCGMTRAFAALGHGWLLAAWGYNRAAPIMYFAFWAATAWASGGAAGALSDLLPARAVPTEEG